MIRRGYDIPGLADVMEALEEEIVALTTQDPYHPQIQILRDRLHHTAGELYRYMPRGV